MSASTDVICGLFNEIRKDTEVLLRIRLIFLMWIEFCVTKELIGFLTNTRGIIRASKVKFSVEFAKKTIWKISHFDRSADFYWLKLLKIAEYTLPPSMLLKKNFKLACPLPGKMYLFVFYSMICTLTL